VKIIKKFISHLYKTYCDEQEFFELKKKDITEYERKQVYLECRQIIDTGVLERIIDMLVAESEVRQLYEWNDDKIALTERSKREGIAGLLERIKMYARKAIDPKEKIEKFNIT